MKQTPSERLYELLHSLGISANAFSAYIGLNRAENIYQILHGKHGISKFLADKIISRYPNISKMWLITGEGEMYLPSAKSIPYYSIDATELVRMESFPNKCEAMCVPRCGGDFAALSASEAMEPIIPQGSQVILKEVDKEFMVPGGIYLAVYADNAVIRRIKRGERKNLWSLIAERSDKYDAIDIEITLVDRLYLIIGVVNIITL